MKNLLQRSSILLRSIHKKLKNIDENSFWNELKSSCKHFIFPNSCLNCSTLIFYDDSLLCIDCGFLLEFISPFDRCKNCFNLFQEEILNYCPACIDHPSLFLGSASVYEYKGVAAKLVKHFKYQKQNYLKEGMGAALFLQFQELEWPLPDIIVPVPLSWLKRFSRGFNQSALLAEELSHYLNRPTKKILKRSCGGFSQAVLSLEERRKLSRNSFYLNKNISFEGKSILLIDDVMTSGTTLRRCAEVLMKGHPKALYSLTFCRT